MLERQLRLDRAMLADRQNLGKELLDILLRADVRCAEPAVVVRAIAERGILRTAVPVGNFVRVVIDVMPDDHIAIFQFLLFQTVIRVRAIDRVHPARARAVRKFTQSITAEAGRCIDRLDIVVVCTNGPQTRFRHGFCIEVINRCVACHLILRGGDPRYIFRQVAVRGQVNVLRRFECADQAEGDSHIALLDGVHILDCPITQRRNLLAALCRSRTLPD